jgi:hypothetical protein
MTTLGRPPLPAEERLSEAIAVLISRAMREDREAQAKASGYRSLSRQAPPAPPRCQRPRRPCRAGVSVSCHYTRFASPSSP